MLSSEGGYVHSEGDANWWIPSGRIFFSRNPSDPADQELAFARQHFFLPHRFQDPFGNNTFVSYDTHVLLLLETEDALINKVTAGERDAQGTITSKIDYRVLQPALVTDPNGNRSEVKFDALGMVVGTAVMGKPGENKGDLLDGFEANLDEATLLAHLQDPLADPWTILGKATTRLVYDLFAYQRTENSPLPRPAVVYTLARETHHFDLLPGQQTKVQHCFSYSDGFGREIQKKIQAEPRRLDPDDPNSPLIGAQWVGSGWTVFNNKGKPVRQYEPFFSQLPDKRHQFEFANKVGVSPILCYDPVERVVATLHPNHTYEKVIFDPWRQETWDVNDTVLISDPKDDPDVGDFFRRLPEADYLPTWYARRTGGGLGAPEQEAAAKTAVHANTPTVAYFDTLGRPFLTMAHNRYEKKQNSTTTTIDEKYPTRTELDIEGNQRAVIDAMIDRDTGKGRVVMRYDYDMLSNRTHQASMEAGERWTLNDVTGKPIRAWDSRKFIRRMTYDELRRPTGLYVTENGTERLAEQTIYGEGQGDGANHRTRVYQVRDSAGILTSAGYDFKGNVLESRRDLLPDYKQAVNWLQNPAADDGSFTSHTTYDALNRPITVTSPDGSVYHPTFNEANLLDKVQVNLRGSTEATSFVTNIDYNAKGQRSLIDYGNGVRTTYTYDPLTFRLVHLLTRRDPLVFPGDCPQPPPDGWPGCQVQNLYYTFDPAGNITHIRDDAQQTVYFRNKRVEPSADYTYDAIFRLIEATGREHLGQVGGSPIPHSYNDVPRVGGLHPGDGNAMGTYTERYVYDAVGNFLEMQHRGTDPANPGWTRSYAYNEASLLEPGNHSNRLSSTTVGNNNPITEQYSYDAHGNMLRMPHLQVMQWDFTDQLQMTQRQAVNAADTDGEQHQGECTWYVYDPAGQRVRKVTELASGQIKDERIYLGGFELYRRHGADPLVRETLHIMDDKQRIALLEIRTQGNDGSPPQLIRYQFGNHLGSASLELDDKAQIISYEEYFPYGSTSYQAVLSQTQTPKRYRYTGKERDEESGMYYHDARYYAPWLGRWISCDPTRVGTCARPTNTGVESSTIDSQSRPCPGSARIEDTRVGRLDRKDRESPGISPYEGMLCNPVRFIDPDGRDGTVASTLMKVLRRPDKALMIARLVLHLLPVKVSEAPVGLEGPPELVSSPTRTPLEKGKTWPDEELIKQQSAARKAAPPERLPPPPKNEPAPRQAAPNRPVRRGPYRAMSRQAGLLNLEMPIDVAKGAAEGWVYYELARGLGKVVVSGASIDPQVRKKYAEGALQFGPKHWEQLKETEQAEERAAYVHQHYGLWGRVITNPDIPEAVGFGTLIEEMTGWNVARTVRDFLVNQTLRREKQQAPQLPLSPSDVTPWARIRQ